MAVRLILFYRFVPLSQFFLVRIFAILNYFSFYFRHFIHSFFILSMSNSDWLKPFWVDSVT